MRADEILENGAQTFRDRRPIYGENYRNFGKVMMGYFPEGLTIETEEEWNRLGLFVMGVHKDTRYATMFKRGGHVDSAHDGMVYNAMLEEVTRDGLLMTTGTNKK